MAKVSVIIPSRNEKYLNRTIEDVYAKATGDIEVIVVLDGHTDYPLAHEWPGLTYLHKSQAEGLRPALRDAARIARGKYMLKLDAHEAVSEGFDEVLQTEMEDNWVVVSAYYQLDLETWEPIPGTQNDYFYLGCPWTFTRGKSTQNLFMFLTVPWISRSRVRTEIKIDDQMGIHASLWMMPIDHFWKRLGGLDDRWGSWSVEQQEIALKTWQGGGRVMVNKNVWNAHYHKLYNERLVQFPEFTRNRDVKQHVRFARYWTANKWEGRIHDFDWLVEKFWPLPTKYCRAIKEKHYWPENWRDYYEGKVT